MQTKTILDTQLIDNLLALFTEEEQETLVQTLMDENSSNSQRETTLQEMLETIDLATGGTGCCGLCRRTPIYRTTDS